MPTPADDLLLQLKTRGPSTAAQIAQGLGVTAQAVRVQLSGLQAQELVEFQDVPAGVGRPRRHWQLSAKGHARFPDAHAELTASLLVDIRSSLGQSAVDKLIALREQRSLAHYRRELSRCRSLARKVARLAALRSEEGYMASWRSTDDGFVLVEDHCPICAAARSCQGFCRSELAIFREVLGPDCEVGRSEHLLDGGRRCSYFVRPRSGT